MKVMGERNPTGVTNQVTRHLDQAMERYLASLGKPADVDDGLAIHLASLLLAKEAARASFAMANPDQYDEIRFILEAHAAMFTKALAAMSPLECAADMDDAAAERGFKWPR